MQSVYRCFCVGGALHIHSSTLVGVDWLVRNVTYRPNCYICFTRDRSVRFVFSTGYPWLTWDCSYWYLLGTLRAKMADPAPFDHRWTPKHSRPPSACLAGIYVEMSRQRWSSEWSHG